MSGVQTGLALQPLTTGPSPAAPFSLAAAIAANPGVRRISSLPRGVQDQGRTLACVSCALAGVMESLNPGWEPLSPLFHYYTTRYVNAGADADGSLFLDNGVSTLSMQGICLRQLHDPPFTDSGAATPPTDEARADAASRILKRIGHRPRWVQPDGPSISAWVRDQLEQDRPVVLGFRLNIGYPDTFLNADMQWVAPANLAANGHCALVIGYSDGRRAFEIQDSRGSARFDGGRWWMSYSIVDGPALQGAYSFIR